MDKKEYKPASGGRPAGMRGPGGRGNGEKAHDLFGTWKKLLGYCRKYWAALIISVICAAVGTVFTLVGPDKLSEITDCVTDGIAPDTEKLEELAGAVSENVSANMEGVMGSIAANMDMESHLPKGELEVNGSVISSEEQMQALELISGMQNTDGDAAAAMAELPDSVKSALYTDVTFDGTVISGRDQLEMMDIFSGLDMEDTDAAMEAFDSLPDSVSSLVKPSIDLDKVFGIGMLLVTLYVIGFLLSAVQGWIMATVTQRVSMQLRSDISVKINRLPMWFYNRTTTGDVLSRVTNDVDTIGQSLNQSIGSLVSQLVLFIGSFIMMLVTDGWMTLTAVLASLLGFVIMFAIMGRSQKYFLRQQKHLGEINGHIEEMYAGHTVVKAYNGEEKSEEIFDRMNKNLCDSAFAAQSLAGLMRPIMMFVGNLGYVAVCVVGGAMALNGKITFGVIVAFMMYVRFFTQPLSQMAQSLQSLQSAAAAGERVFEFLEAEEMEDESGKTRSVEKAQGTVEFSHVKFGYENTDRIIIHDFSAVAEPGQKIAIVGPTGAGKTTLVNLLMRFHEIQGGDIRIDGVPVREMTRENVHEQFAMVLQDTWLFEGSIRENLVYCAEDVTEDKIGDACKAVGLDHFIRTLPKGYDTILNDQLNLSQGQKQQLTIARAMIANKPMLILDEATSSVDTRSEQQIQDAMDQLMENRTSFVIAHRLSTIKNADLILVLKDGDVIESGNHEELLAKKGFYADLYNSQFEKAG